ncbi:MAG: inositol monophosphatase family protein [Pseudomonadota bacterium]
MSATGPDIVSGQEDTGGLLALAVAAARGAGDLLAARGEGFQGVVVEEGRDIKLAADRSAEVSIVAHLRAGADLPVLGEETGWHGEQGDRFWVVDPLDGSANYQRHIPFCAVAIALMAGERPVLGVIHDFNHGETFAGGEGIPATLNGEPIQVSDRADPARSVLVSGLPVKADFSPEALAAMAAEFAAWKKVRMMGSAAMAAAYVAAGRVDRYAESGVRLWDVAAGIALVRAAGGRAELSLGAPEAPRSVRIDNGLLPVAPLSG